MVAGAQALTNTGANKVKAGLAQAGAHGLSGGIQSWAQGGNFGSGFLSGGVSSGIGSLTSNWSTEAQLLSGIAGGGLASLAGGGSFWDGVKMGAITVGLNHALHSMNLMFEVTCPDCPPGKKPGDFVYVREGGILFGETNIYVVSEDGSLVFSDMQLLTGTPLFGPGGPLKTLKYLRVPKGELWYDLISGKMLKGGRFASKSKTYIKFGNTGTESFKQGTINSHQTVTPSTNIWRARLEALSRFLGIIN